MQERKTSNLDQRGTSERGKARKTAKAGQRSYSKKSSSASSRKKGRGANGGRKQREGQRQAVYKYTSEDVSRVVQKRTENLRRRLNDLKSENKVLREILISGFKEWYEENKEDEEA